MPEATKRFVLRRQEKEREGTRRILLDGLSQTRALIAQAYQGFNDACDPDLIESYVFEINALQSRYTYLLRQVKELDGEQAARTG
ncbi:DUF2508 family protein [uncultured Flavonifractor sp.]|uniref:DUF2508 family protein n=1 Tax=uncultured Flavonifractor sp. TaxID=1193534 RepID=UPI00261EA6F6|nr:DUF2508 family protein [uncultured Flavonifractor sp.]